jgi:hypothetical protein
VLFLALKPPDSTAKPVGSGSLAPCMLISVLAGQIVYPSNPEFALWQARWAIQTRGQLERLASPYLNVKTEIIDGLLEDVKLS